MTQPFKILNSDVAFLYRDGANIIQINGVEVWSDQGGSGWPDTGNPTVALMEMAHAIILAHKRLQSHETAPVPRLGERV